MVHLPRLVGLLAFAAAGCNLHNEGQPPPRDELYFPNALALSPQEAGTSAEYLFVANSNYDLRYNSGSVQAISLERLEEQLADGEQELALEDVLADEILISSYAAAMTTSSDGRYLFVAARTGESLTYIDLDLEADGEGVMDCDDGRRCFREAELPADADTGNLAAWPSDPVAMTTGPQLHWLPQDDDEGDADDERGALQYVAVAHRDGAVSLFYETGAEVDTSDGAATARGHGTLRFAGARQITARNVTGIAYDPASGYLYLTRVGGQLKHLLRVGVALSPIGEGSFPFGAGLVTLEGVAPAGDTRAITFVEGSDRGSAALREDRALVVARAPSSLLLVDVEQRERPTVGTVKRITEVGAGPSKIAVGAVEPPSGDGERRLLAVVSCLDARQIYVIDLATMAAVAVVPNLSGPFDVALDAERALLYVADFKTSVLRVLDLAPAVTGSDEAVRVIATIGTPKIVQELQ